MGGNIGKFGSDMFSSFGIGIIYFILCGSFICNYFSDSFGESFGNDFSIDYFGDDYYFNLWLMS